MTLLARFLIFTAITVFGNVAYACSCLPFDEARVATEHKNIYVFEVEDLSLREKLKKLLAPSKAYEYDKYPIKVIQKIKGDAAPSEILRPRGVPCESGELESGMRILIYTNNDGRQIIGACNNVDMRSDGFDVEKVIRKIKEYMVMPEEQFEKSDLSKWTRVPGLTDTVFELASTQLIAGIHEIRIAKLRVEPSGAPHQKYKSALYAMTMDCKNRAYKLGDEYMYQESHLQGARVGIRNLNRSRQPVKEGPNWKSIDEDQTAAKLAKLICNAR